MPHKDDAKFREVDLGDPDGFTAEQVGEREIRVTGVCPRCDDTTTATIRRGVVGGGTVKAPPSPDSPGLVPATIWCECGYYHDGRPDTSAESGCGAYWRVAL
jgi:hypothetical protein